MKNLLLISFFVLIMTGCFTPKNTGLPATHDLVAHATATSVSSNGTTGYVSCLAYYTSDSSSAPINFEADALVTCGNQGNIQALTLQSDGSTWLGTVPYTSGLPVTITVVRPDDGSSLGTSVTVH